MSKYQLDPAHFMSAPGLSWAACLKMTKVELELMTYIEMSMFIDKGLLGGVSAILQPHANQIIKSASIQLLAAARF